MNVELEISFGQLAIFSSCLTQPYNDWTDRHFQQGFTWRPGSVSFRTLVESGPHLIEVDVRKHVGPIMEDAVRVIAVPFTAPADGRVEIGGIAETVAISLRPGSYLLRCEFLKFNRVATVKLTFAEGDVARFDVVRADSELSIHGDLVTTALPASN